MTKNKKSKQEKISNVKTADVKNAVAGKKNSLFPWVALLAGITIVCFLPVLKNEFLNWDDIFYVTENPLLKNHDWKGLLTQPVGSNYHPLTMLSLALNSELFDFKPFSFLLLNLLLHTANTLLVYYFILLISDKKTWVAFFTALLFGIHPMHVESVAWISERKDVLYAFFFLISLIQYWRYLQTDRKINYWFCFLFFILSLLSKPSAIILPLVLFLLDYWKGRPWQKAMLMEKIIFLLTSLFFGILLLMTQSTSAMAGLAVYPVWSRLLFACYVVMTYVVRFFIPYPLSAFHPYPDPANLGWQVILSPLFIIGLGLMLWRWQKNKLFVFSILFFIVNLILVLQVLSIGYTIVAERYTYMPYVGLAFLVCMKLNSYQKKHGLFSVWILPALIIAVFGYLTFQRTKVWKDSGSLWSDVIQHYKETPVPRGNRADYFYKKALNQSDASGNNLLFQQAIEDCNIALKGDPDLYQAYQTRGLVYLQLKEYVKAQADADSLILLAPKNSGPYSMAFSIRGTAYLNLNQYEKAIADFTIRLSLEPGDDNSFSNRGTALYNGFQKYGEALSDFDKAIAIKPLGAYYLNRMRCHNKLGNLEKAKADAVMSLQKGVELPEAYRKLFNL